MSRRKPCVSVESRLQNVLGSWWSFTRKLVEDSPDHGSDMVFLMERSLTLRERFVVCERSGLNDEQAVKHLDEIGHVLNLSRSRIAQIEFRALRVLKFRADLLDRYGREHFLFHKTTERRELSR